MVNSLQEEVSSAIQYFQSTPEGNRYKFIYSASDDGELVVKCSIKRKSTPRQPWNEMILDDPLIIDKNGVITQGPVSIVPLLREKISYLREQEKIAIERSEANKHS